MSSPVRILLKEEEIALDGILQFHVNVEREEHKFLTICDLYQVTGNNIQLSMKLYFHASAGHLYNTDDHLLQLSKKGKIDQVSHNIIMVKQHHSKLHFM